MRRAVAYLLIFLGMLLNSLACDRSGLNAGLPAPPALSTPTPTPTVTPKGP
ncbi:MAG TPA: hypothetical protein VMV05_02840 [bacterium]|nr:hypothetical protein [bacterium]